MVGCIWIAMGPIRLPFSPLPIVSRPRERYSYGLHILPEARRRGIAQALKRLSMDEARRSGGKVCVADVDAWNSAAIAVQRAVGARLRYETCGVFLFNRIGLPLWRRRRKS